MIVGLNGYAQVGKDTAAAALLSIGYERLAYADKLREGIYELNPIVSALAEASLIENARENMGVELAPGVGIVYLRLQQVVDAVGWDEAKQLSEIRELMQRYGTEAGRDIHGNDCWVELVADQMMPGIDYVVTDVRMANEVEDIHRAGGIVVRITRPGTGPVNDHVSDTGAGLLPVDYTIDNNSTIEALHAAILDLVQ
jgi:hypothetical protein